MKYVLIYFVVFLVFVFINSTIEYKRELEHKTTAIIIAALLWPLQIVVWVISCFIFLGNVTGKAIFHKKDIDK